MIKTCYEARCDRCRVSLTRMTRTTTFDDRSQIAKAIKDEGWLFDVTGMKPVMLCKVCRGAND